MNTIVVTVARANRSKAILCLTVIVLNFLAGGCGARLGTQPDARLLTAEGFAQWQVKDRELEEAFTAARSAYRAQDDFSQLQPYWRATQQYIDHGFALYRAYQHSRQAPPQDLITALETRTGYLMDVADEFIKHHSLAMGVGIANEIVRDYSDLPVMAPAQRRAHHVLDEYRGRGDYGP